MPNVGPLEILLLVGLAVLLFGPKRLPEIGRSVGRGVRDFRSALGTTAEELRVETDVFDAPEDESARIS